MRTRTYTLSPAATFDRVTLVWTSDLVTLVWTSDRVTLVWTFVYFFSLLLVNSVKSKNVALVAFWCFVI